MGSNLQVCLEYLERYYVLIAFTAYLFEPGFNPESHHQASLAHWMKRRPELYRSASPPPRPPNARHLLPTVNAFHFHWLT